MRLFEKEHARVAAIKKNVEKYPVDESREREDLYASILYEPVATGTSYAQYLERAKMKRPLIMV